jgi:WD40 repeat protein
VTEGIRTVVMQLTASPAFASPTVPSKIQQESTTPSGPPPAVQQAENVSPPFVPLAIEKLVLPRTLTGHRGDIVSVALSADEQMLVSGSHDNTIKVWNLSIGKVRTLIGHTAPITSVVLSANGQFLVSGSTDCTIKVWGT